MALLHAAGLPLAACALLPSWFAAGAVAALSARVFRDNRIGWAMAVLTPSALLNASLVSTESWGLWLALLAANLVLAPRARDRRVWLAGGLLGLAALFRPVALFPALGLAFALWRARHLSLAGMLLVPAGAVVAAGLATVHFRFGDSLMSVRGYSEHAYGGELLTLPFRSLLMTPVVQGTPLWKIAFVWGHVAVVIGGCVLAWRRWRDPSAEAQDLARLAVIWLGLNTAFAVSIGSQWGFHEFHRFLVPALPPLFWAYGAWLPHRTRWWLLLALPSLAMALAGAARAGL